MKRFLKKLTALALVIVFLLPGSVFAADPALDTTSANTYTNLSSGTQTIAVTAGANTNTAMVLFITMDACMNITTPAYAGSNFTTIDSLTDVGAQNRGTRSYLLIGNATGANNLTIPYAQDCGGTGAFGYSLYSVYNIKQTGQPQAHNETYSAGATSVNADLTTASTGEIILASASNGTNNSNAPSATTGFANNQLNQSANWSSAWYARSGIGSVLGGAGSNTVNATWGTAMDLFIVSMALEGVPVVVPPDQQSDFLMFGEW